MNTEQAARELNQMHIDHARLLSQVANSLSASGEAGVLLWLNQQQEEVFAIDIIEHFGLTPGRVANIVKKLEQRGYLSRQQHAEDLRKSRIMLTPEGIAYAAELYSIMNENHLRILNALGEEDTNRIMHILRRIIGLLDDGMEIDLIK